MIKIIAFIFLFLSHLAESSSVGSYQIKVKFMGRPEFTMTVDLPLRTNVFHLKEEVQNKLLNEYRIRIPTERLILRKEGILRPLKPEDILEHHIDGNDVLYIIGRIAENIDQRVPMEVD